ncbi:MAG TPA: pimeloyl-CoA dehydrogenase small subunit [Alphaproteobacteria bacterium]|nr:pimeloyl-CoA dehydrogenase small subunit [Alphaproteobacteria bacterium]HAJ46894.1 pimeloyl-CoA dehydrogenase small subunit [Alphaproteobacteria bacterium]
MDFSFTEEQTLLRNSVNKFVAGQYDFDKRRALIKTEAGWSKANWQAIAELGLLGAPFAEEHGGLGGGPVETMIIMEELGRGLVVEPYLPTVVLGGGFLRHGGTAAHKLEHIPAIVEGQRVIAFAYAEPQGRYNLADVAVSAKKSGSGFTISGHKAVVIAGPQADHFVVTARTAGGQRDAKGISVFLVPKSAKGVATRDYPTVDGLRASDVTFENVAVGAESLLGEADHGLPLVERVVDEAIAAISAEAVGAMKVLNDTTVEYCKTRKQFGVPIGKFQVLQHRMVDMFMNYEQSVSITYMVTLKLDESDHERKKAASAAKVQIGKAGRFIGQQAVQLHGGMGMTDELNVGHYFKRLTMIDTMFGNVDHHLKRYAALSDDAKAA